jgi:hypothetical protein
VLILAIDPGLSGAIALYDTKSGELSIQDMPIMKVKMSGKAQLRPILDEEELISTFEVMKGLGCDCVVVEHVQGLPRQSAPAAFNFGYGFAALVMTARFTGFRIEKVTPSRWKVQMKVPSGVNKSSAVRQRASELIPTHKHLWPLGKHDGRAEAAMLAIFAERFLFKERRK